MVKFCSVNIIFTADQNLSISDLMIGLTKHSNDHGISRRKNLESFPSLPSGLADAYYLHPL